MPTTLTNGIQLPDKGSVDWYSSMQSNYNLIDTHLGDTDVHVTAEDKDNWNSKQGSLSQDQLDAIAQVATNTDDIATLQSDKADASHTHSSSDITDIDDYATKDYVDNSISGLVDNAPDALNTLNELSAALNDDSNFASTVTTALAAKADSADLATVATSGSYDDLDDKPTIPTNTSDLTNDSDFVISSNLATVATSGDYDDLSNKPSIPTNTSDLNNDSGFVTLNDFDIPSKTSDLTNDSGFITSSDVPTSTSDLINDSNFVDTSNAAVSSGITSAKVTDYDTHIADTDIHVTTADKDRWNNNTYVFRYSSTALTDSSTNSNTLLDNTDNLKVGDKVIDSSGVLFSITAIDTQNSTFTIGTALIDLAQDSDVVHKSGDESVIGSKRFGVVQSFTGYPSIRLYSTSDDINVLPSYSLQQDIRYTDKNNNIIAYFVFQHRNNANEPFRTCWRQVKLDGTNGYYSINFNNLGVFYPENNNAIDLGGSSNRWKSVYATNYYYGSNSVEFSTKFVTTDTNQTITGKKTFEGTSVNFRSVSGIYGTSSGNASINFLDKNSMITSYLRQGLYNSGLPYIKFDLYGKDADNQTIERSLTYSWLNNTSEACFRPETDNFVYLGISNNRWKDVQTYKVNALEPSSLSLPARTGTIDISSYVTDLTGVGINSYTPPANGYIVINCNSTDVDYIKMSNNLDFVSVVDNTNNQFTSGILGVWQPCVAGIGIQIRIKASALYSAKFIPCQGNV